MVAFLAALADKHREARDRLAIHAFMRVRGAVPAEAAHKLAVQRRHRGEAAIALISDRGGVDHIIVRAFHERPLIRKMRRRARRSLQ